jgi:hypothetical protein
MYLPYFKRKVVFCSQKVEKLAKSMGFVVGSKTKVGKVPLRSYNLDKLLQPYDFPTDVEDDIAKVKIMQIRFKDQDDNSYNETGIDNKSQATVYEKLSSWFAENNPLKNNFYIYQVKLAIRFEPQENEKQGKLLIFTITSPNGCNLKSRTEKEQLIANKYLKRLGSRGAIMLGRHIPKDAMLLACRICEGNNPVVNYQARLHFGDKFDKLIDLKAVVPEKDPCASVSDEYMEIVKHEGRWQYFDKHIGWVEVSADKIIRHRFKLSWLMEIIGRDLDICTLHPREEIIEDHLWRLGRSILNTKLKAEIFFARMIRKREIMVKINQAMEKRSGVKNVIILTTSKLLPIGIETLKGYKVMMIHDIMVHDNKNFHIDRDIITAQIDTSITNEEGFRDDYRYASINGIKYFFSKTQAAVVELLHKQGKSHKHVLMSAANSSQDEPKGLFRKRGEYHPAWGVIIKYDGNGYYYLDI